MTPTSRKEERDEGEAASQGSRARWRTSAGPRSFEAIGFRRGEEDADHLTFYVNWFFVTFIAKDRAGADLPVKGAGVFTYIKVDDVDDYHEAVVAKGLKPEGEPQARQSGLREFVLRDPGYGLVFFEK